ncbi:MAG: hypothetical protein D6677_11960 [Calditrichaeota bacterium]|nr:MAG: hypothetical protein D6677_11960 [Calditrichota bacterium]
MIYSRGFNIFDSTREETIMKKTYICLLLVFMLAPLTLQAQLKKDTHKPDFTTFLVQPRMPSLFSWLDVDKIRMQHQVSMSFGSGAGGQLLQNAYINSMYIPFTENLTLQTQIGVMATPYHTFGANSTLNKARFFGSAQLNYKISENTAIMFRVEKNPYGYGGYYNSPYGYGNGYAPWPERNSRATNQP